MVTSFIGLDFTCTGSFGNLKYKNSPTCLFWLQVVVAPTCPVCPPRPPLAGGLSELPDRKPAASINPQKWNERSSAISNVEIATICLVFFNPQLRALLCFEKKENRAQAKLNLANNSFPLWIFCHINLRPLRVNADQGARRTHLADNFVLFATSLCLGTIYGQAMTISNSSVITMNISLRLL